MPGVFIPDAPPLLSPATLRDEDRARLAALHTRLTLPGHATEHAFLWVAFMRTQFLMEDRLIELREAEERVDSYVCRNVALLERYADRIALLKRAMRQRRALFGSELSTLQDWTHRQRGRYPPFRPRGTTRRRNVAWTVHLDTLLWEYGADPPTWHGITLDPYDSRVQDFEACVENATE